MSLMSDFLAKIKRQTNPKQPQPIISQNERGVLIHDDYGIERDAVFFDGTPYNFFSVATKWAIRKSAEFGDIIIHPLPQEYESHMSVAELIIVPPGKIESESAWHLIAKELFGVSKIYIYAWGDEEWEELKPWWGLLCEELKKPEESRGITVEGHVNTIKQHIRKQLELIIKILWECINTLSEDARSPFYRTYLETRMFDLYKIANGLMQDCHVLVPLGTYQTAQLGRNEVLWINEIVELLQKVIMEIVNDNERNIFFIRSGIERIIEIRLIFYRDAANVILDRLLEGPPPEAGGSTAAELKQLRPATVLGGDFFMNELRKKELDPGEAKVEMGQFGEIPGERKTFVEKFPFKGTPSQFGKWARESGGGFWIETEESDCVVVRFCEDGEKWVPYDSSEDDYFSGKITASPAPAGTWLKVAALDTLWPQLEQRWNWLCSEMREEGWIDEPQIEQSKLEAGGNGTEIPSILLNRIAMQSYCKKFSYNPLAAKNIIIALKEAKEKADNDLEKLTVTMVADKAGYNIETASRYLGAIKAAGFTELMGVKLPGR